MALPRAVAHAPHRSTVFSVGCQTHQPPACSSSLHEPFLEEGEARLNKLLGLPCLQLGCRKLGNIGGAQKGGFKKGGFGGWSPGTKNRNEGTFGCSPGTKNRNEGAFACSPGTKNRNEGTFACSPGTRTGTRVHSPKPPCNETALLSSGDNIRGGKTDPVVFSEQLPCRSAE